MFKDTTFGLVGHGRMAEIIVARLLEKGVAKPGQIWASGRNAKRRCYLKQTYGINVTGDNRSMVSKDVVLLCVKPQTMSEIFKELNGQLAHKTLVCSIAAGITLAAITAGLGLKVAVRAMPNAPSRIGQGLCGWYAAAPLSKAHLRMVKKMFGALGELVRVDAEKHLNIMTALSGSGPAFFYAPLEALVDAGVRAGLPRVLARQAAVAAARGAALMAAQSPNVALSELRSEVTSPGGTTAEGLFELEQAGIRAAFMKAVAAAIKKAEELGG